MVPRIFFLEEPREAPQCVPISCPAVPAGNAETFSQQTAAASVCKPPGEGLTPPASALPSAESFCNLQALTLNHVLTFVFVSLHWLVFHFYHIGTAGDGIILITGERAKMWEGRCEGEGLAENRAPRPPPGSKPGSKP